MQCFTTKRARCARATGSSPEVIPEHPCGHAHDTLDEFRKTRSAPGALYSVTGSEAARALGGTRLAARCEPRDEAWPSVHTSSRSRPHVIAVPGARL
jgi:hypothetical protein